MRSVDYPPARFDVLQLMCRDTIIEKYDSGEYTQVARSCLCGAHRRTSRPLLPKDRYGLPSPSSICTVCGIVRTVPRLDDDSLTLFYNLEYRMLYTGNTQPTNEFFAKQIAKGLGAHQFVGDLLKPGGNVADVGCGAGGALIPFRDAGHTVVGCDLGADFLVRGRQEGLDLRHGDVSKIADAGPFDLILLIHVLEHVPDPVGFLTHDILPLLADDGAVYIELPGLREIARFGDPLRYFQNAHLWNFDLRSLVWTAAAAGLKLREGDQWIHAVFTRGTIRQLPHDAKAAKKNLRALVRADRRRHVVRAKQIAHRVLKR